MIEENGHCIKEKWSLCLKKNININLSSLISIHYYKFYFIAGLRFICESIYYAYFTSVLYPIASLVYQMVI